MSLTPSDLHQISLLLDQKLDKKFDEKLGLKPGETLDEKLGLKPGQSLDDKFNEKLGLKPGQSLDDKFDEKLKPIHKTLTQHEKLLKSLKRDQVAILDVLDRQQIKQAKRITIIEQHLNIN